jgi:hypothetical protein
VNLILLRTAAIAAFRVGTRRKPVAVENLILIEDGFSKPTGGMPSGAVPDLAGYAADCGIPDGSMVGTPARRDRQRRSKRNSP